MRIIGSLCRHVGQEGHGSKTGDAAGYAWPTAKSPYPVRMPGMPILSRRRATRAEEQASQQSALLSWEQAKDAPEHSANKCRAHASPS